MQKSDSFERGFAIYFLVWGILGILWAVGSFAIIYLFSGHFGGPSFSPMQLIYTGASIASSVLLIITGMDILQNKPYWTIFKTTIWVLIGYNVLGALAMAIPGQMGAGMSLTSYSGLFVALSSGLSIAWWVLVLWLFSRRR